MAASSSGQFMAMEPMAWTCGSITEKVLASSPKKE
jgi:hypothetical protein